MNVQSRIRVQRWAVTTSLLVVGILGYLGGCASTTLPPALSPTQRSLLGATHFKASVAVEPFKYPVYSDRLVQALQETKLFMAVDGLNKSLVSPDLVARIERPIHGRAAIPWQTGISLGLVPTTVQEEHGYSFSLARNLPGRQDRVPIEFSYSGPSTLGWWCVFLNLSPDRTKGDVYGHHRFREALAWTIVEKRKDVLRLLGNSGA